MSELAGSPATPLQGEYEWQEDGCGEAGKLEDQDSSDVSALVSINRATLE